jgi:2-C-methyl-D-erythritol 4-phosphate cytidylyltransferase
MNNTTKMAIIVAGGKGERMKADIPKQFLEIKGKPILMHTLDAFYAFDTSLKIVLVLPEVQISFWKTLCDKHSYSTPHTIVAGGASRFHSVKNGLSAISNEQLIAIHDGVRPLVSSETIARCFEAAQKHKAAIPVMDSVESIRMVEGESSKSVDRSAYKMVQTPQIFDAELLHKAYEQQFSELFTDDASVVEKLGVEVHLVEGNRENIKITTAYDLQIAEILLK